MDIKDQIGCGYCMHEQTCKIKDPKINKAKLGCKDYIHHEEKKKSTRFTTSIS